MVFCGGRQLEKNTRSCVKARLFFHRFFGKNLKLKKQKSSFRIVNYSVSWGSPCWKKCKGGLKKTVFFSLIFHPKSTTNQLKNRGKRYSQQKSMKKRSLGRLFWENVDFWWFLASQGGPKKSLKGCPIIDGSRSWAPSCAILVIWTPFSRFCIHFGSILGSSGAIFWRICIVFWPCFWCHLFNFASFFFECFLVFVVGRVDWCCW